MPDGKEQIRKGKSPAVKYEETMSNRNQEKASSGGGGA